MLESGSNMSFRFKRYETHLTMNLARANKSEESELLNISVVSTAEEHIQKSMRAYAINKPCSPARTVSRKIVDSYSRLKVISNKLYLSGGTVDLLIGTDFPDAFIDMHVIPGNAGEPIWKEKLLWMVCHGTVSFSREPTFSNPFN